MPFNDLAQLQPTKKSLAIGRGHGKWGVNVFAGPTQTHPITATNLPTMVLITKSINHSNCRCCVVDRWCIGYREQGDRGEESDWLDQLQKSRKHRTRTGRLGAKSFILPYQNITGFGGRCLRMGA